MRIGLEKEHYKQIEICYEVLDSLDLRYTHDHPKGYLALYVGFPHWKTGIPSEKYKDLKGYYSDSRCSWCGETYLKKHTYTKIDTVCSDRCQKELTKWKNEWYKKSLRLKNRPSVVKLREKVRKRKIEKIEHSKRYFELMEKGKTRPLYDRYKLLKPYYDIIRNPKDEDLLLIKCSKCSKYYEPNFNKLRNLRAFVNGNNTKKPNISVYCSSTCYKDCRKLRKDITHLWKSLQKTDEEIILDWHIIYKSANKHIRSPRSAYFKKLINKLKIEEKEKINRLRKEKEKERKRKQRERELNRVVPVDPEELKIYIKEKALERIKYLKKKDPKKLKTRRLLYYSRVRAKEKNLEHSIDNNWLKEKLLDDTCELTGLRFSYDLSIPRNPFGPSIDRVDINKGYTPENCRIVIWAVNAGLGHYSEKDLYKVCKAYLNFNNIK